MEQLLQLTTNPYFVGFVFFVTLGILHFTLVYKFPLTARQWKLAEYVWVTLALVSVFGVFEEARILRAMQTVAQSEKIAEKKVAAVENWFDVYSLYACEGEGDVVKAPDLCAWVNLKKSELALVLANEDFPADIPSNLLLGLDTITTGIGGPDREIISGHLNAYYAARTSYLTAVAGSIHTSFSSLLISLAPLMFALAVALKFAKVSGEYRLMRK